MKVSLLRAALDAVLETEGDIDIEIATQEDQKDEWYEVVDAVVCANFKGRTVLVLNTD